MIQSATLAWVLLLAALPAATVAAQADVREAVATYQGPTGNASRDQLSEFFERGTQTLNVFCEPNKNCAPIQRKEELFKFFFRGAFAQTPARANADVANNVNSAYAYHAAAYFTEPEYDCRHPLTARVLESLWELPPRPQPCAATVPFLISGEGGGRQLRMVQPERVAAVHLLFAGESGQSLSRFGHVSLRLVVCAPERMTVDAGCDEDLYEHLTLGFRAAVDELDLSVWKGIAGGYSLRLYADPFMSTYDDYTIQEFRSLSSLPMHLNAAERGLLVHALAEVHWAYQNDYRFFTQNCASELSWLLRVVSTVAGASPAWLKDDNIRPDKLFRQAQSSAAFASERLEDLGQAEKDGFHFPSSAPYYQLALDTLLQRLDATGTHVPVRDFKSFRALDAGTRRSLFYLPALSADIPSDLQARLPSTTRSAHAALVLEAWMERRTRRDLLATLARYYANLTDALLAKTELFSAAERTLLTRCMAGFANADQLGRSAEGVPVKPVLPESGCDVGSAALKAALEKLYKFAPLTGHQERQLSELQSTVNTVDWLLPHFHLITASTHLPLDGQHE